MAIKRMFGCLFAFITLNVTATNTIADDYKVIAESFALEFEPISITEGRTGYDFEVYSGGVTTFTSLCINDKWVKVVGIPSPVYFYNNKYLTEFEISFFPETKRNLTLDIAKKWLVDSFLTDYEHEITIRSDTVIVQLRADKPLEKLINPNSNYRSKSCTLHEKSGSKFIKKQ